MHPTPLISRRAFARRTALTVGALTAGLSVGARDEPPVRHRFLCCDYQGNKVAIVAADGAIEWEFAARTPQDCWQLPNGNILFCHHSGVREVTRGKEIVWEYQAPATAQCHSCQPLPDGRVLVAECGLGRLVEVRRDGKVAREIKVDSHPAEISHQFRGTRKTADGHYWVCLMDERKVVELSPDGTLLRGIGVPGFPHAAVLLPDNHLLVTLGQDRAVVEYDEQRNIVWRIDAEELPGNPLRLAAGCQRLPNGNTIVCNYLGGFLGKQPQVFEVTEDKHVVWEFADHAHFKTVNQIFLLDQTPTADTPALR